jgi:hypothetical protein
MLIQFRRLIFSCFQTAIVAGFLIVGTTSLAQNKEDLNFPQNSTKLIRVKPGPLASQIGSAVKWRKNLDEAIEESSKTGKPVFWYIPTLRGTFMDRKDSIDRYMLAGPFSWPSIIELLNRHFVPIKGAPQQAQQLAYDIKPYVFVEPGFVILAGDGKLVAKYDQLTTLHTAWLHRLISSHAADPEQVSDNTDNEPLASLWRKFAAGDYDQMDFPDEPGVESLLLAGMVDFRLGKHDLAKEKWNRASELDQRSPLAWKAAAEAEGFGPFVRGFEVFGNLNERVATGMARGSAAPPGAFQENELWNSGIRFLLGMQSTAGGWYDSDYDFGGTDSLPNVRTAISAIAGIALIESLDRGYLDDTLKPKVEDAIKRATTFVLDNRNLNLADRDEIFWAYAYRVRFLSRLVAQRPELQTSLVQAVKDLESVQMNSGGFFHEYPNPMTTALALIAFAESADVGVPASAVSISRGVTSLKSDRFGNGGFTYSSRGRVPNKVSPGGQDELAQSSGRMPLCELGLWLHESSSQAALSQAVKRSFELAEPMMKALKYDNHTSNYGYGGFFIWYDIEARGEAIHRLEDADLKASFQQIQRELIFSLPEIDGCFVDSHELGRVYGTAMGLISLAKTNR